MNDTEICIRDPVQLKIIMAVVGLIFIYLYFFGRVAQAAVLVGP